MKKILPFLFFLLSLSLLAQHYPVKIVTDISYPSPVNFYNYADATSLNSPIKLQIYLNDLTISSRQIRLKIYFKGNNISFESKNFVLEAEDLFLEGGIPLTLKNTELAPYFNYDNLQGISQSTYAQAIPEGSYDFCFEVFDYITGNKLSAKKCAKIFIFKNDPPLLNRPLNKSNIESKDFENIIFDWTPRHLNVSNVEYEFSLVEIWDNNTNPQTAFLSQIPIYQETTRAPMVVYGADKPQLLSNKRYAWRVQAKALQGLEEIGLFRNEGYSEIFWFSRITPCEPITNIKAEPKGLSKVNIYWDENPTQYSEYVIEYRQADKENAAWFTKKTNSSWATIWDLKQGTTYEYRVKGKCGLKYGDYSAIQKVSTEVVKNENSDYQCGIVPDGIAISNREPHPGLISGSEITAGDFKVVVTEITSQSSGRLSGKGYVVIPYLNFVRFAVEFTDILVNTDNQLAQGEIVTVYDKRFGEGASMTVNVNLEVPKWVKGDQGVLEEPIEVGFYIKGVDTNADGAFVIKGEDENGNPKEAIIPGGKDKYIKSKNGDIYKLKEDGTFTKVKGAKGGAVNKETTSGVNDAGQVTGLTAKGVKVTFEKSGYYSFDNFPKGTSSTLKATYKSLNDGTYLIPYKAISDNNKDDFVYANIEITDNTISKDSIVFKTKSGASVTVEKLEGDDAKVKLILECSFDYANEEIYATVKNKEGKYDIAGALVTTHLASKEIEPVNVVLVSLDADKNNKVIIDSDVKEQVKAIYAKAGVRINFDSSIDFSGRLQDDDWDVDEDDDHLKTGNKHFLGNYNNEQLAFIKALKRSGDYKKEAYYVFVTSIPPSEKGLRGYMRLKSQFGFVFVKNIKTKDALIKTIAHELGHGIFGLEHSYKKYNYSETATKFLMDYSETGTVLNHLDWKQLHAPGFKLYMFQDVKQAMHKPYEHVSTKLLLEKIPEDLKENVDGHVTFFSRSGAVINIPKTAKDISFKKNRLLGFTIKNNRYFSTITEDNSKFFRGYGKKIGNTKQREKYEDNESEKLKSNKHITVYYLDNSDKQSGDCGAFNLVSVKYLLTSQNVKDIKKHKYLGYYTENDNVNNELGSTTIEETRPISKTVFNCIKKPSLKVLYKYFEYSLPKEKKKDFEKLITKLDKIADFKMEGLLPKDSLKYDSSKYNKLPFKLEDNSISNFNYINKSFEDLISRKDTKIEDIRLEINLEYQGISMKDLFKDQELLDCILYKNVQPNHFLLPTCLWQPNKYTPYSIGDLPLIIGFSEGFSTGVVDIIKLLGGLENLQEAYTYGVFMLEDEHKMAEEYGKLLKKLKNIGVNVSIETSHFKKLVTKNSFLLHIHNYMNSKADEVIDKVTEKSLLGMLKASEFAKPEDYKALKDKCNKLMIANPKKSSEYAEIRNQFIEALGFIESLTKPNNKEALKKLIEILGKEINTVKENSSGISNLNRYYQGRLMGQVLFEIGGTILTGGGKTMLSVSSKVLNLGGKYARGISKIAKRLKPGIKSLDNIKDISRKVHLIDNVNDPKLIDYIAKIDDSHPLIKQIKDLPVDEIDNLSIKLAQEVKNTGGFDEWVKKYGNLAKGVGKNLDFSPSWLPNRTITGNLDNPKGLLGVYERQLPNGAWVKDTKKALDDIVDFPVANASNFRTVSKDGYKILNTPQGFYQNADQFWTQYNKPWLDDLVSKKADITILSDKTNDYLKYKWNKNPNTGRIEFDMIPGTSTKVKTGFGREIEYMENLVQQGKYEWDGINGVYKAL